MVVTFTFQFVSNYTTDSKDVMLIGDKRELLVKTLSLILPKDQADFVIAVVTDRLKESEENPTSVEVFVRGDNATSEARRVVVTLLPTVVSRHNTPTRSHAVATAIKSNKGKKDLVVMLCPSNDEWLFAQAVAISRPFPLYNLQSNQSSASITVDVVLVPQDASFALANASLLVDIENVSKSIRLACRLVDTPPNILHSDMYVDECRQIAQQLGSNCSIKVIQGKELEEQGFGGLWGVGKASEQLPALVILSHVPKGKESDKSICLVGKGIVYDTGGLSIKTPTTSMAGMKTDMGGSAAVLGAFEAAVSSGVKGPFHALLCIAENSVGPAATRPDDVHVMLSGKTVEVNNTDAEGRLVLSDGCFYASKYLNPKVIIDIATLTGAQCVATGKNHAAIYCNDDELEASAIVAGKFTGDLVFPIPYCPEFYKREFKSEVADMKNSVACRMNAQASCAAQFIGNHLETYLSAECAGKWLHVDMAGPCNQLGDRATGYGVALLFELLKKL